MSEIVKPNTPVSNLKCGDSSCHYSVASKSGHDLCSKHRECNNGGYYDPNRCNFCRSLYASANAPSISNPIFKTTLAYIHRSMDKSSSFYYPLVWVDPEFKTLYHDPVFPSARAPSPSLKVRVRVSPPVPSPLLVTGPGPLLLALLLPLRVRPFPFPTLPRVFPLAALHPIPRIP